MTNHTHLFHTTLALANDIIGVLFLQSAEQSPKQNSTSTLFNSTFITWNLHIQTISTIIPLPSFLSPIAHPTFSAHLTSDNKIASFFIESTNIESTNNLALTLIDYSSHSYNRPAA